MSAFLTTHLQLANTQPGFRVPEPYDVVSRAGYDPPSDHLHPTHGPLVLTEAPLFELWRLVLGQRPHSDMSVLSDKNRVAECLREEKQKSNTHKQKLHQLYCLYTLCVTWGMDQTSGV